MVESLNLKDFNQQSLIEGVLYDVSPTCTYSGKASKNTSCTSTANTSKANSPDSDYDSIFESYSKIWRDATMKEFNKQTQNNESQQSN